MEEPVPSIFQTGHWMDFCGMAAYRQVSPVTSSVPAESLEPGLGKKMNSSMFVKGPKGWLHVHDKFEKDYAV